MCDLFIIIVNWNTADLLKNCLGSILDSIVSIDYKICVVDNSSVDNSIELIRNQFPNVFLIENSVNRGYSAANNQALRIADGRYILLLNSDTILKKGSIDELVKYANDHPTVGIIGPKLLNAKNEIEESSGNFPSLERSFSRVLIHNGFLHPIIRESRFPYEVDYVNGACMLVRKKVIDETGLLDEDFFMYGEDIDYCFRAKKLGWKVIYHSGVEIYHLKNSSGIMKWGASRIAAHRIAERLFYEKHYSIIQLILFDAKVLLFSILKIVMHELMSIIFVSDREIHRQFIKSYWRVFTSFLFAKSLSQISERID
jgi:GT2 family glycosyltransferase